MTSTKMSMTENNILEPPNVDKIDINNVAIDVDIPMLCTGQTVSADVSMEVNVNASVSINTLSVEADSGSDVWCIVGEL